MKPGSIASNLFYRLWTKAVGTPDYDKEEWKRLEKILQKAAWGLVPPAELTEMEPE